MRKIWQLHKHDYESVCALATALQIQPVVAALLIARGHGDPTSARRFLAPSFDDLHDPSLLMGIGEAIDRIESAIQNREKILVWGDYDVDGTTGTVLLRKAFDFLGAETEYHIPNRFTEGYGINTQGLTDARDRGCKLAISVDCGIKSFEPLEWASANGLDVIVTDHHLSDESRGLPAAVAVVNPNQAGCPYPDKNLAGVGVAFKIAQLLLERAGHGQHIRPLLKIAAIGTVADVMRLTGENRAIVALGLKDLHRTDNLGLKAMMEIADCRSEMTSYDIGFRIGPRINAAGRMDVAHHVIELLESRSFGEARRLAALLDARNRERQQMQQKITDLALVEALETDSQHFVVVAGDGWHQGVIGLAASRIAERLGRPAIVLSINNGVASGSARTANGIHLIDALDSCSELFEQYGGHAAAAGMKIITSKIPELRERLNAFVGHSAVGVGAPSLNIDALLSPASLDLSLVKDLTVLEPFGPGNPKPIFTTRDLSLISEPLVMKEKHLKLRLRDRDGRSFEAVWWSGVEKCEGEKLTVGAKVEVAYSLEVNEWNGSKRLQLVLEDARTDNGKSV